MENTEYNVTDLLRQAAALCKDEAEWKEKIKKAGSVFKRKYITLQYGYNIFFKMIREFSNENKLAHLIIVQRYYETYKNDKSSLMAKHIEACLLDKNFNGL